MADAHTLLEQYVVSPQQGRGHRPARVARAPARGQGARQAGGADRRLPRARAHARVGPGGLPRLGPRALRRAGQQRFVLPGRELAGGPSRAAGEGPVEAERPSRAAGGRPRSPGQGEEGGLLLPRDGDRAAALGGRRRQGAGCAGVDPRAERRGAAAGWGGVPGWRGGVAGVRRARRLPAQRAVLWTRSPRWATLPTSPPRSRTRSTSSFVATNASAHPPPPRRCAHATTARPHRVLSPCAALGRRGARPPARSRLAEGSELPGPSTGRASGLAAGRWWARQSRRPTAGRVDGSPGPARRHLSA